MTWQLVGPVVVPALVAFILVGAAHWWTPYPHNEKLYWCGAWGLALAFMAGFAVMFGVPSFPPTDSTRWFFYFAVLAGLAGVRSTLYGVTPWPDRIFTLIVAIMILRALLHKTMWGSAPAGVQITAVVLALAGLPLLWFGADTFLRGSTDKLSTFTLMMWSVLLSVALLFSGTASLAQLAGALAAALGAFWALSFAWKELVWEDGALPVFAFLGAALILTGHLYAELPLSSAILFFASFFLSLIAEVWLTQSWLAGKNRRVIEMLLTLALAGIGTLLAALQSPKMEF
jgi:hypothetical protein